MSTRVRNDKRGDVRWISRGCPLITAHGDPGRAPCPALYKWKVGISTLEMPSSLSKSRTLIALSPSPSPSTLDPRRLLFPLVDYPRALQMVRPTFPCPTIPAAQQAGPVVLAQGPRIWLASASLFPTPSSPPFRDIHILNANNHTLVSQEDRGDVNEDWGTGEAIVSVRQNTRYRFAHSSHHVGLLTPKPLPSFSSSLDASIRNIEKVMWRPPPMVGWG